MTDTNKDVASILAEAIGKAHDSKPKEALDIYDNAIANGIEDVLIHSNRGLLLEQMGRLEDALNSFQKAAAIESNFRDHYNAGNMLLSLERHSEAIEAYQASLQHRDDYPECWVNLGIARHAIDHSGDAENAFRKALEINPSFYPAHRSLAILLASTGQTEQATNHYRQAAQAQPQSPDAWFEYGCALYKNLGDQVFFEPTGPEGQAVQAFDKAIELDPNRKGAWGRKIGILFRLTDAAQATDNAAATQGANTPQMFPLIHNELVTCIEAACARFPDDEWFSDRQTDAKDL